MPLEGGGGGGRGEKKKKERDLCVQNALCAILVWTEKRPKSFQFAARAAWRGKTS